MKTTLLSIIFPAVFFLLPACNKIQGEGPTVSRTYHQTGFSGVYSSIDADVYFTQDSVYSVEIYGQQNILNLIETPVEGGTLQLRFKCHQNIGRHDKITVYVSAPAAYKLGINGSGMLQFDNVSSSNLNLVVNGSGSIYAGTFWGGTLKAEIFGSGKIRGNRGVADYVDAHISGSGDISVSGVKATNANASISGSGYIAVYATNFLEASISGSGTIRYKGAPEVSSHISGSGNVGPF